MNAYAVALLALATGCIDTASEYRCASDPDCTLDGKTGRCVRQPQDTTGFCAFADDDHCGAGGYRYHERAGERANLCSYVLDSPTAYTLPAHLDAATDRVKACGAQGAREAHLEIFLPARQYIFIDTPGATIATRIGIAPGACPASAVSCEASPCPVAGYDQRQVVLDPGLYCVVVEQADAVASGAPVDVRVIASQRDGVLQPGPIARTTCDQAPDPQSTSCSVPGTARAAFFGFALCPNVSYAAHFQIMSTEFQATVSLRAGSPVASELTGVCGGGPCCKPMSSLPGSVQLDATLPGPGPYFVVVERAGSQPDCGTFSMNWSILPM